MVEEANTTQCLCSAQAQHPCLKVHALVAPLPEVLRKIELVFLAFRREARSPVPKPAEGILGSDRFEGVADRLLKERSSPSLGSPHRGCALREHLFPLTGVVDAPVFGQVLPSFPSTSQSPGEAAT